ncbi:MAG: hypothetical protein AAGC58_05350, partial [Asticcacaulis sp.]
MSILSGTLSDDPSDDYWVKADLTPSLTYASLQNAVPVLRSISVANRRPETVTSLTVELASYPGFLRTKTWAIDRLEAGEELTLSNRRVDLDAAYLAGLNEAERGTIRLTLRTETEILETQEVPIR